ncbi:MAG TPA: type II CAAX endopeptidase family protein [Draconibacterium sp.]|nr:type II CAAX endopeptidase family protein [Draconibacterium sp.]
MNTKTRILLYWLEFLILFFGVPLFLLFESRIIHPSSVLLPVLVALIIYFKKQKDFHLRDLVRLNLSRKTWLAHLLTVLIIGIALLLIVVLFEPENLFNLPRRNPGIWIAMLFFYPIFSAYGQEIVFRKFLFMRYKKIFPSNWLMILASGVTFSFAHILYFNTLAMVLSFLGGLYLAYVYSKTGSVLFATILHGIMGFMLFTVGLGQHFWNDMLQWL